MARDFAQEARDNLNQGLPKHEGLDEGTRAAAERSLGPKDNGIAVGSFADLQLGRTDIPIEDRPLNPLQDPEGVITVNEHVAREGIAIEGSPPEGAPAGAADGSFDDSFTVEELKDALAERDLAVSGTKQELIDRLNE